MMLHHGSSFTTKILSLEEVFWWNIFWSDGIFVYVRYTLKRHAQEKKKIVKYKRIFEH